MSLFDPFSPTFPPVEARLVAQALSRLSPAALQLSFQMAFADVFSGSNADRQQYTGLEKAQTRLTQPFKYEVTQGPEAPIYMARRVSCNTQAYRQVGRIRSAYYN